MIVNQTSLATLDDLDKRLVSIRQSFDLKKDIVENFKAYVETGKVTFKARMMLGMLSMMSAFTPKAMRAENWPLDKAE